MFIIVSYKLCHFLYIRYHVFFTPYFKIFITVTKVPKLKKPQKDSENELKRHIYFDAKVFENRE